MELEGLHLVFLAVGLVVGGVAGWFVGHAGARKKKKKASGKTPSIASLPPKNVYSSLAEASKSEVFSLRVCRADVNSKALFSIIHHLKDVVVECRDRGDFGHQVRVVLIDVGEWDDARQDNDVLAHFVRMHEACPHLAFWLTDDCLENYLDFVHRGLQLKDFEDLDSGVYTWNRLREEIVSNAPEAMVKDMGGSPPDGLLTNLVGKGVDRVDQVILKLDPTSHSSVDLQKVVL